MVKLKKIINIGREKVVIRFYGSSLIPFEVSKISNSIRFKEEQLISKLSVLNLYPKILDIFPGGRIESFVPGRILTLHEINTFLFSSIIARKLARLHSFSDSWLREIGIERDRILFTTDVLKIYIDDFNKIRSQLVDNVDDEERKIVEYFQKFDFQSEIIFLTQKFNEMKSKIVFSHNDLHHKNIYLIEYPKQEFKNRIILMDYEYASFNHRWADFAVYFTGNNQSLNNRLCHQFSFSSFLLFKP